MRYHQVFRAELNGMFVEACHFGHWIGTKCCKGSQGFAFGTGVVILINFVRWTADRDRKNRFFRALTLLLASL